METVFTEQCAERPLQSSPVLSGNNFELAAICYFVLTCCHVFWFALVCFFFCRGRGNFCSSLTVFVAGTCKAQAGLRLMEQKRGVSQGADLQLGK